MALCLGQVRNHLANEPLKHLRPRMLHFLCLAQVYSTDRDHGWTRWVRAHLKNLFSSDQDTCTCTGVQADTKIELYANCVGGNPWTVQTMKILSCGLSANQSLK